MPSQKKQRKHFNSFVDQTSRHYVHPSLASPTVTSNLGSARQASSSVSQNSVNELIEHSRRAKSTRFRLDDFGNQGLEASQWATSPTTTPNPRTSRRRGLAGPPPPRSWTVPERRRINTTKPVSDRRRPHGVKAAFPDGQLPEPRSLFHHVLRNIAVEWDWHLAYDHYYLATLPTWLKMYLLSYVACYGPDEGCGMAGLRTVFAERHDIEPQLGEFLDESAASNLEVTQLDLTGSIGRSITLKQLDKFISNKNKGDKHRGTKNLREYQLAPASAPNVQDNIPESWDQDTRLLGIKSPSPTDSLILRFPNLTRLSLADPSPQVSWSDLLNFMKSWGAQLSHLSLANWPGPTLPSAPTNIYSTTRITTFATLSSPDEKAYLFRQLCRYTPELFCLNLERCEGWFPSVLETLCGSLRDDAFSPLNRDDPGVGSRGKTVAAKALINTSWRKLKFIKLDQAPQNNEWGVLARLLLSEAA